MHDDGNGLEESRGGLLGRCPDGRPRYAVLVYFVVAAIRTGTALVMVRAGAARLTQEPSTRTRRGRVCYRERLSKRLMLR